MDRAIQHDVVLVLQGGGALGSYQAGVFEALAGEGVMPTAVGGISEAEVVRNVMLKETVDGEFTTVADVAEVALFFAAFPSNAVTGSRWWSATGGTCSSDEHR